MEGISINLLNSNRDISNFLFLILNYKESNYFQTPLCLHSTSTRDMGHLAKVTNKVGLIFIH
jgi:hypothetical protein